MNREKIVLFFKDNVFVITFVFMFFLFFWKLVVLQESFLLGDYSVQHVPWSKFLADSLKNYSFPLWTPYMHSGFPILAEGQIGALYPPNLVLFFLLPFKAAYTYNIILHIILASVFMYIYARCINMSKVGATISVLVFLFGSGYGGCFYGMMSMKVLVWFPLVLFLTEKLFEKGEISYGILIGVFLSFQILAGYHQIALYSIVISTLYFLVHLTFFFLKKKGLKKSITISLFYLTGAIVAFGLSAAQLFATLELTRFTDRLDRGIEFSMLGSYFPLGLIQLLFPQCTNGYSFDRLYVGIIPFFLCLVLFFCKKDRYGKFFIFLAVLSLLLAFGKYSPLYVGLIKAVGFYGLRIPAKFLFFTAFSLAILAGYGFDKYCLFTAGGVQYTRFKKIIHYIAISAVTVLIIANAILRYGKEYFVNFGRHYVDENVYGLSSHRKTLEAYYEKVDFIYQMLVSNTYIFNTFNFMSILILLASIFIIVYARRMISLQAFKVVCIIVIAIDLYAFNFLSSSFRGDRAPIKKTLEIPEAIEFLKKDTSLHRVYCFMPKALSKGDSRYTPNYNMFFQISDISAYSPLVTNIYYKLLGDLGCVDDSLGRLEPSLDSLSESFNLLSLLNVKYILAKKDVDDSRLELVYRDEQINVYKNEESLPRAFFVSDYKVINNEEQALELLKSKNFSPKDVVVLDEKPVGLGEISTGTHDSAVIEIRKYSPQEIILNVTTPSSGILVFSDLFYPGWEASVDREETKIMKANTALRAVVVPEGKHIVKFVYDPRPFNIGLRFGFCTLIGIPIIILVSNMTGRKKH